MFRFIPPKSIKQFQRFNHVPFSEVPRQDFEKIKAKVAALQSDTPLISVVLIAWNEEAYILSALASLAETKCELPMELIVVNNNSTDDTQKFIEACGFKSVFETAQGYAHARQAGLKASKGQYIVSGDADTMYTSLWVELITKPLLREEAVCTYTLHAFYTENNKYPLSLLLYQQAKLFGVKLKNMKRPHLNCGGASMAYKKSVAEQVGGYNLEVGRGEDGTLAFEMSRVGPIQIVPQKAAMIYTNMRRTQMDGNLGAAFLKRILYHMRYFTHYFKKQKEH